MSEKRSCTPDDKFDGSKPSVIERGGTLQGFVEGYNVPYIIGSETDDRYNFGAADTELVQRKLKQRHIQMIAIAGTIGTGLFLGSGRAISGAGPLGALISYALVGTVAYATLCSVGEMASLAPISGAFVHYAARWVDPALGFALGWMYFYGQAITIPVEITASQILITYWDTSEAHAIGYTVVICIAVCLSNVLGVQYFGESEFIFAIIKLTLITGLLIAGLIIDLGGGPNHDRIGFRYWNNPGALARAGLVDNIATDRFIAIVATFVQAAFSFQGVELVAIAASETRNPRRNIAKAVRRVFWRIVVFYILGIIMSGMLVPYNDVLLLNGSNTAAASPYVIAIQRAGIKALPSVINAAIFTAALSAGNSYLFCSSRILHGLAVRGQAPRFLLYTTKAGLPIVAVFASCLFAPLAFMNLSAGSTTVFNWFVSLATVGGFFCWASINLTYVRFWQGHRAQGIDRTLLPYHSRLQPWLAIWGFCWTIIFILVNGFTVFFPEQWNLSNFLTAYINLPIFAALYIGYKVMKRTRFWRASEMDFLRGIPCLEETEEPEHPPKNLGEKIFNAVF
ncbi:general amino acid permease 1 [Vararia minispora EC-137]|uniref:General amino acid permease 1 n=1 Tax=Vararia minispora EC-137 TaxID=1314806 RepID=A0ACB8QVK8_9AGAM|nr:general amino acid permease 1 [Vararia minispora EC-137]